MLEPVERIGLIQIEQLGFIVTFYTLYVPVLIQQLSKSEQTCTTASNTNSADHQFRRVAIAHAPPCHLDFVLFGNTLATGRFSRESM